MRSTSHRRLIPLAAFAAAGLALAGADAAAEARSFSVHDAGNVNVNVSFNTQMPLADMSDKTMAETQKRGRIFVYNMANQECETLLATIAATCRLANLSVSTQVRNQNNNNPVFIYLNGNARYMITLKDSGDKPAPAAKP
ncbi:MAG: hypothetical protein OEO83_01625 [Alphaproteobacteria bacterium]|nr:hypothetical protein [Alphaproteobacteria bacterium]